MRFSDLGPLGGSARIDPRATGSVMPATAYQTAQTYGATGAPGTPVPAASVQPTAPRGWPTTQQTAPLVYGRAPTSSLPGSALGASGMSGRPAAVERGPLASVVAKNPTTDAIDSDPIPRTPVQTANVRNASLIDRVRRAVPSMPTEAVTPVRATPAEPLRTRVEAAKAAVGWNGEGGRVTVGEGQTLYNLSKRFGVPVAAIMAANGITDPTTVRMGQTLVIPRYTYGSQAKVSAPDANPLVRASTAGRGMIGEVRPSNVPPPSGKMLQGTVPADVATMATGSLAASAGSPSNASAAPGTVVVAPGDTLYALATRHGVSLDALRAANGLNGDGIRIGQRLVVPDSASTRAVANPVVAASTPEPQPQAEPEQIASIQRELAPATSVVAAPRAEALPRVAAPSAPDTEPSGGGGLRWPVNGRVIGDFGGAQKGIDIAVPNGTAVRAAEAGTVIYAGSGLKEFGKTVLIQHPDGLVTVYGHADNLNVAKGQKVERGDVIAASGMTGSAKTPRVHFQVRKGATPVDPSSYLR